MLLSICLTAGGGRNLSEILSGLSSLADEILVICNNLTEEAVELARENGARLYRLSWFTGDEPLKDNRVIEYGLKNAQGEWVLFLSADESLIGETGPFPVISEISSIDPAVLKNIRVQLKNKEHSQEDISGYYFKILRFYGRWRRYNFITEIAGRLFKRDYRGRSANGNKMIPFKLDKGNPVIIKHSSPVNYQQKNRPDCNGWYRLEVLKEQAVNRPDNLFLHWVLGEYYFKWGRYQKALYYLSELTELLDSIAKQTDGRSQQRLKLAPEIYRLKALAYLNLGNYHSALDSVKRGLDLYPDFRVLWFIKGLIMYRLGSFKEARKAYRICLSLPANPLKYLELSGLGSFRTLLALGMISEKEGDDERAIHYFLQACQGCPGYLPAREGVQRIYRRQQRRVLEYLDLKDIKEEYDPIYELFSDWLGEENMDERKSKLLL